MSVGYAAFQTNLNITAKGNISNKTLSISELKSKYCNAISGDGLYVDTYENGRCVYRGANPNNYIIFNDEEYRIVSIESDGTIKIKKEMPLESRQFDTASGRYKSNTYCNVSGYGCNVWGSSSTMLNTNEVNVTTMAYAVKGTQYQLPTSESPLNVYLNGSGYYDKLSETAKNQIFKNHVWNVGVVYKNNQYLKTTMNEEKTNKWKGNIGLISPTDYLKASLDVNCNSIASGNYENSSAPCKNNNYLQRTDTTYFTLSAISSDVGSSAVWAVSVSGCLTTLNAYHSRNVVPALYLKSDISLSGEGTQSKPYTIIS